MEYEIIYLSKDKWKGTIIPIKYSTDKYYDVLVNQTDKGFNIKIRIILKTYRLAHLNFNLSELAFILRRD